MTVITVAAKIGSGKALVNDTDIPTPNGVKKLGEIKVGDIVFGRHGERVKVAGVFPQGKKQVYRVTTKDGSSALVNDEHLWTVGRYTQPVKPDGTRDRYIIEETLTTRELMDDKAFKRTNGDMTTYKYKLPNLSSAVVYDEKEYKVDPYVLGVFLGDGATKERYLTLSSNDEFVVNKVAGIINATPKKNSDHNFSWTFKNEDGMTITSESLFGGLSGVEGLAHEKHIPEEYLYGNEDQRLRLLNGLMDTDGSISIGGYSGRNRYNVSFSTISDGLANDIVTLANSLGIRTKIGVDYRDKYVNNDHVNNIHFYISNLEKEKMFSLPAKKKRATEAKEKGSTKINYDYVSIVSIEDMGYEEEMTCLYVDSDEHLFLVNDFMVTHNTEITKLLAKVLDTKAFYEPVDQDDNPILPMYYADQKKYGFLLQIFFLNKRFDVIKEAYKTNNAIIDSSIYTDSIFLDKLYHDGIVTAQEHGVYHDLVDNMMEEIEGLPYKKRPDLMIGIDITFENELERIGKRGREFEQDDDLIEYFRGLSDDYEKWYAEYDLSPKFTIDGNKYDFVNNLQDRREVLLQIVDTLYELDSLSDVEYELAKVRVREVSEVI